MKTRTTLIISFILFLASIKVHAYDPCSTEHTDQMFAKSQCFNISQPIQSSFLETSFNLRAVLLTKTLEDKETKETMILIPGGPGSDSQAISLSLNQKDIVNAFWAHLNLNVVLYDPRGTGASKFLKDAEYYPQEVFSTNVQVEDLLAVVRAVSPQKPVILMAHSAGGNTAALFAAKYPERVKGLILYSASIDAREIGESNLRLFSEEFVYWKDYLLSLPNVEYAKSLEARRSSIEKFLKNVLKLQRIEKKNSQSLRSRFYLKEFRADLVTAVENDKIGDGRVTEVLSDWQGRIDKLSPSVVEEVKSLENLKFDKKTHVPPVLKRSNWIKTAVICSEGITKKEFQSPLWLEGLDFRDDTCQLTTPLYDAPPSRNWLKGLQAPTLLLGGSEDPYQVPSAVRKNAASIENAEAHIIGGAGHEPHLTHPMQVYTYLKDFIENL